MNSVTQNFGKVQNYLIEMAIYLHIFILSYWTEDLLVEANVVSGRLYIQILKNNTIITLPIKVNMLLKDGSKSVGNR
jgi:hypothetical protein